MNNDIDSKPIARIYCSVSKLADSDSQASKPLEIQGMGFLITARHVLTCAHVIESAVGVPEGEQIEAPKAQVKLDFPFAAEDDKDCFPRLGQVIYWRPTQELGREADIAVLQLDKPLPILPVKISLDCDTHWQAFGFPKGGSCWSGGTFRPINEHGWRQMNITSEDAKVEKGFSGTPVWHGSHSTVIGMLVARTSGGYGNRPAFMLPSNLLKLAIGVADAEVLFDYLSSDFEALLPIARQAYQHCLPSVWGEPKPKFLKEILESLGKDIPDINVEEGESYSALTVFVAELVEEPQLPSNIREALERWLASKPIDVSALKIFIKQRRVICSDKKVQASLLFQVSLSQKDDLTLYRVKAWLVPNPAQYDATSGQGCEPLTIDEDAERTFALNEIPGLLERCLNQAIENYRVVDPTIEIFLPLARFDEAVDVWELGSDEDEDEDDPLAMPEQLKIGWRYRVVLRSTDRVGWRYQKKSKRIRQMGDWQEKWRQFDRSVSTRTTRACDVLLDGSDATDPRPLLQRLTPLSATGVKFFHMPAAAGSQELITTLNASIPVAIWLRYPIPNAQTKLDAFLTVCLDKMLENTTKKRLSDGNPQTDLGCHLALLWDNPNLLPPFERHAS